MHLSGKHALAHMLSYLLQTRRRSQLRREHWQLCSADQTGHQMAWMS